MPAPLTEYQEQKLFVEEFRKRFPKFARCLRLSLNGVNLGGFTARTFRALNSFKAQGMVLGESDLFLAIPTGIKCGLFIEMKVKPNKPTKDQQEYLDFMAGLGYRTAVCYNAGEAMAVTVAHMEERARHFPELAA